MTKDYMEANYTEFKAITAYHMTKLGLTQAKLAPKIRMTPPTISAKLRNPRTFRYDELLRLCTVLQFDDAERSTVMGVKS